jgi:hypothetical protein
MGWFLMLLRLPLDFTGLIEHLRIKIEDGVLADKIRMEEKI